MNVPDISSKHFDDTHDLEDRPELLRVLRVAARALQSEDQSLRSALEAQEDIARKISNGHGLTYWVYETTLVYTIWKAWLRETKVSWEVAKRTGDKDPIKWFDLRLEIGGQEILVEAKWWNSAANKALSQVLSDIDKLEGARETNAALLLTFWWGVELGQDLEKATRAIGAHGPKCSLKYCAAFRADSEFARKRGPGYFAVVAWMPDEARAPG